MRIRRFLLHITLAAVLATVLPACSMSGGSDDGDFGLDGEVTVTISTLGVTVSNGTDETIFAIAFGRETAAAVNWVQDIADGGIAPGGELTIPFEDILGSDEQELILYWWDVVTENGERVPGEIRSIVVER